MAFDLFGSKEKQAAIEREILQKMSQLPILDRLIKQLLDEDLEDWMAMGQSYYDSCKRSVNIEPDEFELKWSGYCQRVQIGVYDDGTPKTELREEIFAKITYSFTQSG